MSATSSLRRGFLAVVPPTVVVRSLDDALEPVRAAAPPRLTWTRQSQWHFTVRFLGPVHDVHALLGAVGERVVDVPVFTAGLGGTGAFPSARSASVVWVGLDEGADAMAALAAAVGRATEPIGYPPERQSFTPHLTVARARRPLPVGSLLASIGAGPFGRAWDVREVVLFESDTRSTGAVHREIAAVPLGA
jgi:2'-5' RNA ligase